MARGYAQGRLVDGLDEVFPDGIERNFMVPLPRFSNFLENAFNQPLEAAQCRIRISERYPARSTVRLVGERLTPDLEAMAAPTAAPFEALRPVHSEAAVSLQSRGPLLRPTTRLGAGTAYHQLRIVHMRGYVERAWSTACGGEVIARHGRSYESVRTRSSLDGRTDLPMIEQKIGVLADQRPRRQPDETISLESAVPDAASKS